MKSSARQVWRLLCGRSFRCCFFLSVSICVATKTRVSLQTFKSLLTRLEDDVSWSTSLRVHNNDVCNSFERKEWRKCVIPTWSCSACCNSLLCCLSCVCSNILRLWFVQRETPDGEVSLVQHMGGERTSYANSFSLR